MDKLAQDVHTVMVQEAPDEDWDTNDASESKHEDLPTGDNDAPPELEESPQPISETKEESGIPLSSMAKVKSKKSIPPSSKTII